MKYSHQSYGIMFEQTYSAAGPGRKNYFIDADTDTPVAEQQIFWLIRKGDLLCSNVRKTAEQNFLYTFYEIDNRKLRLCIYEHCGGDDIHTRFQKSQIGKWALRGGSE
jgi:hypothetical protein